MEAGGAGGGSGGGGSAWGGKGVGVNRELPLAMQYRNMRANPPKVSCLLGLIFILSMANSFSLSFFFFFFFFFFEGSIFKIGDSWLGGVYS